MPRGAWLSLASERCEEHGFSSRSLSGASRKALGQRPSTASRGRHGGCWRDHAAPHGQAQYPGPSLPGNPLAPHQRHAPIPLPSREGEVVQVTGVGAPMSNGQQVVVQVHPPGQGITASCHQKPAAVWVSPAMGGADSGATMLALTGGNGNPAAPPALLTVIQHSMTSCSFSPALTCAGLEALARAPEQHPRTPGSLADADDAAWRTRPHLPLVRPIVRWPAALVCGLG